MNIETMQERREQIESDHLSEVCSGGEYDPLDKDNFVEAFIESISTDDTIVKRLAMFAKTGNAAGLQEALVNVSVKYWLNYAFQKAENAIYQ